MSVLSLEAEGGEVWGERRAHLLANGVYYSAWTLSSPITRAEKGRTDLSPSYHAS